MIAGVIVTLLALVAAAYVAAPFRGAPSPPRPEPRWLEEARARKRSALTSLVELEEDAATGKIAPADLVRLRGEYEVEAVDALHALEEARDGDDDELEAEIRELRERMICPSCGAVRTPDRPCPRCGT